MSKLQDIFNRIQDSKKEQKKIKSMYKDALKSSSEYNRMENEIKDIRMRKKVVEDNIKADMEKEMDKLEIIKNDIDNDNMLLSDAALASIVAGKEVVVIDEHGKKYDPLFLVIFKKN